VRWKGIEELTEHEELGNKEYPELDIENFKANDLIEDINNNQYKSHFKTYLPKEIRIETLANRV